MKWLNIMAKLFLRPQDKVALSNLLAHFLPNVTAWAYGSRINGTAHEGSDLDIVLRSHDLSPINSVMLEGFIQALKESTIPISKNTQEPLPCLMKPLTATGVLLNLILKRASFFLNRKINAKIKRYPMLG